MVEPGPPLDHPRLYLHFAALDDPGARLTDVGVAEDDLAQVAPRLARPVRFHDGRQVDRLYPCPENPGEGQLVSRGGMEARRRVAETTEQVSPEKTDGRGNPKKPAELGLEGSAAEGTGEGDDRPIDLFGRMIVHDDAAPGVGRPFGARRLGLGDDGQRRPGQMRMSRQRQKDLSVREGHVGDDDKVNARFGQAVGDSHGLMGSEDPLRDNGGGVGLAGGDEMLDEVTDGLFGRVLGLGAKNPDGVDDQPDFGDRPPG
jgi:hypothetical protein